MNTHIGIWIDYRKALVITIKSGKETLKTINSGVDESHPKGGYGSSTPYGSQDAISEKTYLERRKHQLHAFYSKILKALTVADQFMVMGPAEAKTALVKEINKNQKLKSKLTAVETVDSITENQIKAKVRAAFE